MAEEDVGGGGESKRSRFLHRSKWGKIFKENDSPTSATTDGNGNKVNSFKLNDDVVDFLKPSTEKNKPKLDIAVAQRWPAAHEVKQAAAVGCSDTPSPRWTGYRKSRRREGLVVTFAKGAPDIIGEGGDEAPDPVSELGKRKAAIMRSASHDHNRAPSARGERVGWNGSRPTSWQDRTGPRPSSRQAQVLVEDFRPAPMRRVQTSHNEVSPPVQRKVVSPPIEAIPHRPRLGRTPTGVKSNGDVQTSVEQSPVDYDRDDDRKVPVVLEMPKIELTRLDAPPERPDSPGDTSSPVVVRRRDKAMQANEGMALRRVSTLLKAETESNELLGSPDEGFQPSPQFYNALTNLSTAQLESDFAETKQTLSPEMTLSPDGPGPSPFEDPRYIKRLSGEVKLSNAPKQPPPIETLRQPRRPRQVAGPRALQDIGADIQAPRPTPQTPAQSERTWEQSSYVGAAQQATASQDPPALSRPSQGNVKGYMRHSEQNESIPSASGVPVEPQPGHQLQEKLSDRIRSTSLLSQSIQVPRNEPQDRSQPRAHVRDRIFGAQTSPDKPRPFNAHAYHSSGSLNCLPASTGFGHNRTSSHDGGSPVKSPESAGWKLSPADRPHGEGQSPQYTPSSSSRLNPASSQDRGAPSPYARGPSPADYFAAPKPGPSQSVRSLMGNLRALESERPGSSGSGRILAPSPQPPPQGDPAADLALADFAGRVAHMKGVFDLTAERERPSVKCTSDAWLRTALWWYFRGKAGLEAQLQQRGGAPSQGRELLTQAHVDLSKAWWIASEKIFEYDGSDASIFASSPNNASQKRPQTAAILQSYIKSLSLQMQKNQLMPPHQSLIQGQDTRIWLDYPRFASDAVAVLNGSGSRSDMADGREPSMQPLQALPLGDNRDTFCYGRFVADVSINTKQAETDRVPFPCMITMLRSKRDYQTSIIIASQSDLVSLQLGPRRGEERGLSWHDVSWKSSSSSIAIQLPRGFDLTACMSERDFGSLWNIVEYSRKVDHSMRVRAGEMFVRDFRLAELQYSDSAGTHAFPAGRLRSCTASVFERTAEHIDGGGRRRVHRGYRLLLATDPSHKSLSSASHELGTDSPILFESVMDSGADGTSAMVINIREQTRNVRALLVLRDTMAKQDLYDTLNGIAIGQDEEMVAKASLTGVDIQPALGKESFSSVANSALQALRWSKAYLVDHASTEKHAARTVESESLRIVAKHTAGSLTDHLNLGKGELLLRLPCAQIPTCAIQILRMPQEDLTMSIDTRTIPPDVTESLIQLYQVVKQQMTVRTYTFASLPDVHAFQTALTGHTVRYDGIASTFSISHRMMVISINQRKQATNVRLQVVQDGPNFTQILAFMEDFSLADALCFQVKSTDTFERVKGDGKSRKWAVKFVDAKFKLPARRDEKGEVNQEELVRRRYVNLEGLEYAEEHDDISVGFDTEEGECSDCASVGLVRPIKLTWCAERDRFAEALPAEAKVSRGITLKRRI